MKKIFSAVAALVILTCLGACTSSSGPASGAGGAAPAQKPAEQKTETATGREAFQKLYATARMWAPDARPYREQSLISSDSDGHGGKAAVWSAGFASPSRRSIRVFTWSGTHDPNSPSFGISQNTEDSYSPSNTSTQVFDIAFLKSDSDKAFEAAQTHGGDKLLKKDPKQHVVYVLSWDAPTNALLWHVIYGSSETDAKLRIAVDATKGVFTRIEH